MASACSKDCINDVVSCRIQSTTYVSLHRWPESEAEFIMRSVTGNLAAEVRKAGSGDTRAAGDRQPRVVDCISCRQIYLRSYRFSRKETVQEKTKRCLEKVKERARLMTKSRPLMATSKVVMAKGRNSCRGEKVRNGKCCDSMRKMRKKMKECFIRLLSCTAQVDVADDHHDNNHKG